MMDRLAVVICLFIIALLSVKEAVAWECDFEASVPTSWLQPLKEDEIAAHMEKTDEKVCLAVNKYYESIGKQKADCTNIPAVEPPVMRLKEPSDTVAYFSSPLACRKNQTNPLYVGYVLIRQGRQIGFELRVGYHKKALEWWSTEVH